ncbi:subtilisin-like protease SBT3 [Lycium ferocissimum]|uniref:subtilisin-like protease SBT3 n=1 Tax=Lycium ferocissimum TaxID=112874 RepID=UPI00281578E9|nr:subtilisin-like protease SBT3 [Lycium ferocissimum]
MGLVKGVPLLCLLFSWFLFVNSASEKRTTYIIHMDKSFMPKAFASLEQWHSSILETVKLKYTTTESYSNPTRVLYSYDNAFHGFSAVLSENELQVLEKLPGFVSAYADKMVTLDTTHTFEFLGLNRESGLWPASDYGEDVIVGVIDSGIWPESGSFKDDGITKIPSRWKGICEPGQEFNASMCNNKLIGVRYFNKGVKAMNPNITISMNSGRDTYGHGTHTSSTVGGNYVEGASFFGYATGTARGVAPRARLAMYKVLWDEGRSAADVLAGMDQAVADGVDVISISMGFNNLPLYEDPIAIASFSATEKGILVSASAGNAGVTPGRLHNGIPWVLTTAAGSVDRVLSGKLTLGNGQVITGWSMYPASALVNELPLIYNESISSCNSTSLSSFNYGIIICENGYVFDQIDNIARSSAPAAIYITDDPNIFQNEQFEYPGVVISPKDGATVISYAKSGANAVASISFQQTFVRSTPAPVVASYTSRGPSPSCQGILKPDIMAPGSLVLASWIPNVYAASIYPDIRLSNEFTMISGTSMACPHSSGIAALLKGAHPEWSPAAIRSAMITGAINIDNTNSPIKDSGLDYNIATPLAMGAGLVNPNFALNPGLIYDATSQDYVNLLCAMNFTRKQILTITRSSAYTCQNASLDLNYPSFIALYTSETATTLSQKFVRTVTNVGNGPANYSINMVVPSNTNISVDPPRLSFTSKYETLSYTLTVEYRGNKTGEVVFGSLTWVDVIGLHAVTSPIVVAPMIHTW